MLMVKNLNIPNSNNIKEMKFKISKKPEKDYSDQNYVFSVQG